MRTLLLALILCITANSAYALDVKSMRVGVHKDKIRIVLDLSQLSDFRTFMLSDPYRMVIDLPDFHWNTNNIDRPKESFITAVRKGALNQSISRIVLDLAQPALIQSAFMLPAQDSKQHRLVIDYTRVTPSNFLAQKGTVHGTLKTADRLEPSKQRTTNGIPIPPQNSLRPTKSEQAKTNSKPKQIKPLIVIDPGHGGVDPGAIGHSKIYEKDVVLALSKELKKQLTASGQYRVILTRNKDVFIRLRDRVAYARKHKADLFISIHADSIKKRNVRGTSVYTLSKKASDAQTAKLAEKENQADLIAGIDLTIEDEQVAFILGDFLMTDTMNQSNFLANTLVEKLKQKKIRTLDPAHRYAGFAVLKAPDIPSILIETGFMSNRTEAALLNQPAHRKKVAEAIHAGIDSYFSYTRRNEQN